jgi:hypothetical protein
MGKTIKTGDNLDREIKDRIRIPNTKNIDMGNGLFRLFREINNSLSTKNGDNGPNNNAIKISLDESMI